MRARREVTLHPASVLVYTAAAGLMAVVFTNPVYLLGLLAAVACAAARANAIRTLGRYLALMLPLLVVIVLFNCLFCAQGATVILSLPWGAGRPVTLEALLYGMTMGVKLTVIVFLFGLYNEVQDGDAAFSFFSRYAFRSAFIAVTASLMVPRMRGDLARIGAAMRKRGARLSYGPPLARLRAACPLVKVLLLSSLEGSLSQAESMHCRAFGAGPRTLYRRPGTGKGDWVVIAASLFSLAGCAAALATGSGLTNFYPAVGPVFAARDAAYMAWILSGLVLAAPVAPAAGKWKSTLSKT
jgi:energy-coupling factor transport system permease protein